MYLSSIDVCQIERFTTIDQRGSKIISFSLKAEKINRLPKNRCKFIHIPPKTTQRKAFFFYRKQVFFAYVDKHMRQHESVLFDFENVFRSQAFVRVRTTLTSLKPDLNSTFYFFFLVFCLITMKFPDFLNWIELEGKEYFKLKKLQVFFQTVTHNKLEASSYAANLFSAQLRNKKRKNSEKQI